MKRSQNPMPLFAVVATSTLVCHATIALASGVVASPEEPPLLDIAKPIFDAIMAGHYLAATALAVVLIVALAKRYAPGRVGQFLHSDIGGPLAAFLTSLAGAFATALLAGSSPSWNLVKSASGVAFVAAGGYALLKRLIVPRLQSFANIHPWAKPWLAVVMWIFDKPTDIALAESVKNGDAAVAANPGQGATTVVGQPEKL